MVEDLEKYSGLSYLKPQNFSREDDDGFVCLDNFNPKVHHCSS